MTFHFRIPNFIFGTRRDDLLEGTGARDWIFGGRGADEIDAGAGNDVIFAGKGNDTIRGGEGNDYIDGGRGFDTATYEGSIDDYNVTTVGRWWWSPTTIITRTDSTGNIVERDTLKKVEAAYFEADDYTLFLDGRNNAVLARDDTATTDENTVLTLAAADLTANDREFDGDAISVIAVSATSGAGATVSLANGEVTYDPGTFFDYLAEGETAEDTFTYTADDGEGGTDTATVTVTITGRNDDPVANNDSFTIGENQFLNNGKLLANDTDAEGDDLTIVEATINGISRPAETRPYEITTDGGRTATVFVGDGQAQSGNDFLFNPVPMGSPNFDDLAEGETDTLTFTYTISDGNGGTSQASATVTIEGRNDAPVITSVDTVSIVEGETAALTVTASDPDTSDTLMYSICGGADAALFEIDAVTGALAFLAPPDFEAPDDNGMDNVYDVRVSVSDGTETVEQDIQIAVTDDPDDNVFTLELFHIADQEASTGAIVNAPNLSAVLNALRGQDLGNDGLADNTLTLSSGDAFIPGVFFGASEAAFGSGGIADILIQNELGIQAVALGNHEFDFGPQVLADLISGAAPGVDQDGNDFAGTLFPYLSTNLDFSTNDALGPLEVAGGGSPLANTVTSSSVIDVNGEQIGVVGATTPTLARISSPGDVGISPAWAGVTPTDAELDALAAEIQTEVDAILAANPGMNKVILLAHMQQLDIEVALAERLTDVDIIVAGGSNTRLFDDNDVPRPGDSVQGAYPIIIDNAGGTQTAVVNTDGSYKYVGRLVLDFDNDGNIIADSYDEDVSGAYATDDAGVAALGAEGLVDEDIQEIVDAIETEIIATESNVFGLSDVFLNGNRTGADTPDDPDGVRSQETNLGNLTADANLDYANELGGILGETEPVLVSIKNGGGIRASIGETIVPPGGSEPVRSPNGELRDGDGNIIKPEGGISQNDIATSLAFNNGLTLLTLTKAELIAVLEHGVANPGAGQFAQLSGVELSYDPDLPVGDRIQTAVIVDASGNPLVTLVENGEISGDPAETFRIVTLSFLADGGDGYPFPTGPEANRVDLFAGEDDTTRSGDATFANDGTEQDALAEYLDDNFSVTPYNETDTGRNEDIRTQNLSFRDEDIDLPTGMSTARINEFHYDNDGNDTGEFVEVRTDAGEDVSGLLIELYNGSASQLKVYDSVSVSTLTMTTDGTYDYYLWEPSSIQNGGPDGMALSNSNEVIEFLSYEGTFEAVDGSAAGITSTDIGASQTSTTPVGSSLQRSDDGSAWILTDGFNTAGSANATTLPLDARINEFHYDNEGSDVGEFIELRVNVGADASSLKLELYNGNGGGTYGDPLLIADALMTTDGTYDYYVFDLPTNGLQNGAPDGFALIDGTDVIDFLSYEGSLTATGGIANGLTSTDIGNSEAGSTPVGSSLQRSDDGTTWALTEGTNTSGAANGGGSPLLEARINEFHYDNDGGDVGEFIELRVNVGADASSLGVELYNGSNGTVYDMLDISSASMTSDGTYDYYVFDLPPNGLQNGSPEGIALSTGGDLIEFVSYEGTVTGSGGFADGVTSTDVGVVEGPDTPVGGSIQRSDDGSTWTATDENSSGTANGGGGGPGGDPIPLVISEVQGAGADSTRIGELVTVMAIVTGDFQNGDTDTLRDLQGFFLQEEVADQDSDAATSEGLFVFEDGNFLTDVSIGDRVEVTGVVGEAFGKTQITASAVEVIETGAVANVNTLAQTVNLDAEDDLEAFENMLVTFEDTLTINEMFNLDRFNEIRLTAGDRPQQFTQFNDPNNDSNNGQTYLEYLADIESDQVVFDDGLGSQNEPIFAEADLDSDGDFDTADGFTMGDQITGLTGVLDYGFGDFRVRTAVDDTNTFVNVETREDMPPEVGGTLTVASFNVLNFFTTLSVDGNPGSGPNNINPRGANTQAELDRQLDKLLTTLEAMDADIFGLVELENEFGGDQNGDGQFAIGYLVDELNARIDPNNVTYSFVDPGRSFVDTGDAISVGLIYKPTSVTLTMGSVEILDDSDLDGLGFGALDDDGIGVFDGISTNRAPLAATFTDNETDEDFTVAVTHMKSKGGSGTGENADQNDGAGNFNALRTEGVEVLDAWLDDIGDKDGIDDTEEGDILVLGDFNAYAMEDPIDAMIANGYLNLEGTGADTFVFDGQTGTLDYAFANAGLADNVTGAEAWHINSDEPDAIDYNTDFDRDETIFDSTVPYRTSDHDPLLVGLDFSIDLTFG